jgi:uncharacterized SAM-binding protein YcdF (DUF218 family)
MLWNRVVRTIGGLAVIALAVSAFSPLWNYLSATPSAPHLQASGAIVVLSAAFFGTETLSDESVRRALYGIRLYRRQFAPILVLSGRSESAGTISEARLRAELASQMGVPDPAIVLEETANTTREEATRIHQLLQQLGVKQILLVTESLHMRRAARTFQHVGFEVIPAPSDQYPKTLDSPQERVWLMSRVMQEAVALIYYRVAGYV